MATNDFKPFATGAGANVTAQAEWASLPALFTGFQSGKASSAQVNKAIRQASFISAALAQYVTNKTGQDVLDDGDMAGFIAKLVSGLGKDFQPADATLTNLSGKSVSGLLSYLGLGEGSALPVGAPIPWSSATPPIGWLKCNGAAFTAAQYPKLALAYPALRLPDLRGEFIRGWDDGRGVDSERGLLSFQQATGIRTAALDYFGVDETITGGTIGTPFVSADSVAHQQPIGARIPSNGGELGVTLTDNSMSATQIPTALSTPYGAWITLRPRNIAFNYIVRAA